jgi:hypothetical protein
VLAVIVLGIWAAVATGYWQPLAMGLAVAGVQLGYGEIARRRIKLASDPLHSWWTVVVCALAVPLLLVNFTFIQLTGGRIFPK